MKEIVRLTIYLIY
ncbi:hypothetical protein DMN91_006539 [Ooceraea biroi]|uniref:Uncharacterized protein n=1 Tax=Ooceraea biroi TaxID=2015173 RepID=A0A3L8DQG9_OOCBI|nr:hypothetical protein DMN91_006539 [Ooceraea biroi]